MNPLAQWFTWEGAPCQVGTRSVKLAGLSSKSTCKSLLHLELLHFSDFVVPVVPNTNKGSNNWIPARYHASMAWGPWPTALRLIYIDFYKILAWTTRLLRCYGHHGWLVLCWVDRWLVPSWVDGVVGVK